MIRDFDRIPVAIPDADLRGQVFNYFYSVLAIDARKDNKPSGSKA
jgi:hypothetical protein